MQILKFAIKNIYRYRSKYKIYGVIYFILLTAASVSIAIHVRGGQINNNLFREFGSTVRISRNIIPPGGFSEEVMRCTREEWLSLRRLPQVRDVAFLAYYFIPSFIQHDINVAVYSNGRERMLFDNRPNPDTLFHLAEYYIVVRGSDPGLAHLCSRDWGMLTGRRPVNDNEAVINRVWELNCGDDIWNSIEIGDEVLLRNHLVADVENHVFNGFRQRTAEEEFERQTVDIYMRFIVVGILDESMIEPNPTFFPFHPDRRILDVNFRVAEAFEETKRLFESAPIWNRAGTFRSAGWYQYRVGFGYDAIIYLQSHEILNEFTDYMWYEWQMGVYPSFPYFDRIYGLIRNNQANALSILGLLGFLIVPMAILITVLLLNNRKYDIAVLRSIGMKKGTVIRMLMWEKLIFLWSMGVFTFIPALFIAQPFIRRTTAMMAEFLPPVLYDELSRVFHIRLAAENIGLVLAGATALVFISTIITCIHILRFEPLEIYNKQ